MKCTASHRSALEGSVRPASSGIAPPIASPFPNNAGDSVGSETAEVAGKYPAMEIDFSDLKRLVNMHLDKWDHCLLINENDRDVIEKVANLRIRYELVPCDPTAERLSQLLYKKLEKIFTGERVSIDYVTVFENENSKATYSE